MNDFHQNLKPQFLYKGVVESPVMTQYILDMFGYVWTSKITILIFVLFYEKMFLPILKKGLKGAPKIVVKVIHVLTNILEKYIYQKNNSA